MMVLVVTIASLNSAEAIEAYLPFAMLVPHQGSSLGAKQAKDKTTIQVKTSEFARPSYEEDDDFRRDRGEMSRLGADTIFRK